MISSRQHRSARDVLHVDDRRLPRDRNRFLERPDPHLGVDRRRERPRQLDAVAPDGAEARQRER